MEVTAGGAEADPDGSGNEEAHQKFVDIAQAYDVLSTPSTRKVYDKYGHEGLERQKSGGSGAPAQDPFDLFSRFFGGGGHFGRGGGQRRGTDTEVRLALPLRDFYVGHELDFTLEKQQICEKCGGSGSADGKVDVCGRCGGHGMVVQKHMLAPGIFQQIQMPCDKCGGRGKSIRKACRTCSGHRVVRKPVTLSATVERGMGRGSTLVFENEADESPDWVAGDVIITLDEEEPQAHGPDIPDGVFFRRRGDDLFWREVLSLREAWMGGWSRNITHLDGHIVRLGRPRGQVVQPHAVETLAREGMPLHADKLHKRDGEEDKEEYGRLFVEYIVVLPDLLDAGVEAEFWELWEKWRAKAGVDLRKDSGRPVKDEL